MGFFCNEILKSPFGDQWNAVSGTHSYKYMPLPKGEYLIGETFLVNPPEFQKGAYRDQNGFAWFTRLQPQFSTPRTGLAIHPDGNLPGTEGVHRFEGFRYFSCLFGTHELTRTKVARLLVARLLEI